MQQHITDCNNKNPLQILPTSNFEMFEFLPYQRDITLSYVEHLSESMRRENKLRAFPIKVTKPELKNGKNIYRIIDGQHRYLAAKKIRCTLWYFIDADFKKEDLITYHDTQRNWTVENYMSYHISNNVEEIKYISHLNTICSKYHKAIAPLMQAIFFLGKIKNIDADRKERTLAKLIRSGKILITDKANLSDFILITLPKCREISNLIATSRKKMSKNLFFNSHYIQALCRCFKHMNEEEYLELWDCLMRDYVKFVNAHVREILEMFEKSYNFKKTVNVFDFSEIYKQKTE